MTLREEPDDFLAADGTLAPPMTNGEVIFEAPWQGRVFGIARAMVEAGVYEWDEFRACLIDELAGREAEAGEDFDYYGHFLRALETLLVQKALVSPDVLNERFSALLARPHGHDHTHRP